MTAAPRSAQAGAPASRAPAAGRTPELDGIRGLAILIVMLHHMTVVIPDNAVDRWWLGRAEMGSAGVDLFFVLSGFLITGILLDSRRREHYFRNFYIRRTLRIFPLYYAVVALSLLVLPHIPNPKTANLDRLAGDEIWYWLYLSNFSIAIRDAFRHGILDISWSLAIEEQFYLVWPALVYLLSRRALKRLCIGLLVFAPLARLVAVLLGVDWIPIYVLTPLRVDALAAGALIAILAREGSLAPLRQRARWIGLAALAVWLWFGLTSDAPRQVRSAQVVMYSATTIAFASFLVWSLTAPGEGLARRALRGRFLTAFGMYSYGLYLFHLPLRALIRDTVFGPARFPRLFGSALPGQLVFYVLAIALSFAVALASWHLYEKHFLRLKDRFPASVPRERTDGGIEGEPPTRNAIVA